MEPELSIVIPAHNESGRLRRTLSAIFAYLESEALEAEVIVVDDGSADDTRTMAETLLADRNGRVISYADCRGKGHAVRVGVADAAGRWILMSDADLSTPIEEYSKLKRIGERGNHHIVIGSRAVPGSEVRVSQSWLRQSMGKCFNLLVRLVSGLRFRDTQCGFKLFRRDSVVPIFQRLVVDGFAFDVELLMLCRQAGLQALEVPVVWKNDMRSSVHLLSSPPRMLWDVLQTVIRLRQGRYGPLRWQPSTPSD